VVTSLPSLSLTSSATFETCTGASLDTMPPGVVWLPCGWAEVSFR
jgi:hypothetical protein